MRSVIIGSRYGKIGRGEREREREFTFVKSVTRALEKKKEQRGNGVEFPRVFVIHGREVERKSLETVCRSSI